MEEDFRKKFKGYTDDKLIQVLINEKAYQPIAVQVAKEEALSRNISLVDLSDATRGIPEASRGQESKVIPDVWRSRMQDVSFDAIDRLYTEGDSTQRSIMIIAIVFCLMVLTEIWSSISYWIDLSFLDPKEIFIGLIPFLYTILGLIVLIILILKREVIGWYLASVLSGSLFVLTAYPFVKSCAYYIQNDSPVVLDDYGENDLIDLISMFEPDPPLTYAPMLIITVLLLYLLLRRGTVVGFGLALKDVMVAGTISLLLSGGLMLYVSLG